MLKTRLGAQDNAGSVIRAILNSRLADVVEAWLQGKQARWGVAGPVCAALHALFGQIATEVEADAAAWPFPLQASPADTAEGQRQLEALARGLAGFAVQVRRDIERCSRASDAVSAVLLTEVFKEAENYLWFVDAHLRTHAPEAPLQLAGRREDAEQFAMSGAPARTS
mgnify:CR=1 FL=1